VKDTKHAGLKVAVTAAVAVAAGVVAFRTLQPAQAPTAGSAVVATGESGAADSTAPAAAGGWTVDVAGSTLGFSFVQAGATTAGSFGQYTANIDFKPAPAPGGSFDVRIETASVDTLDKDRNEQLKTTDLFDVAGHPQARYVATQFSAQGDGFEAKGELTLRGVTKAVPLHFTYATSADGKSAALKGTASIKRLEFGVGQGEWKSTEWVSDDVQVSFNLRLVPPAQ
jgi:polyisoprenoid-binding protein YceI